MKCPYPSMLPKNDESTHHFNHKTIMCLASEWSPHIRRISAVTTRHRHRHRPSFTRAEILPTTLLPRRDAPGYSYTSLLKRLSLKTRLYPSNNKVPWSPFPWAYTWLVSLPADQLVTTEVLTNFDHFDGILVGRVSRDLSFNDKHLIVISTEGLDPALVLITVTQT